MVKFKCKISDLENICKLVSLKGKNPLGKEYRSITDMLLSIIKDKIEILAMDTLRTIALRLTYNVQVIEEGQIPIGDIELFEKFLSRFKPDDDVTLSLVGNKILIERESPKKTAKMPAAAFESIMSKDNLIVPKLEKTPNGWRGGKTYHYSLKMEFDARQMADIIEDGEVVHQRIYPWKVANKKVFVSIGSEPYGEIATELNLDSIESELPESKLEAETAFAAGIDNLFGNLDGKITVYLAEGMLCPMIVEKNTDNYSFFAILVPYKISE